MWKTMCFGLEGYSLGFAATGSIPMVVPAVCFPIIILDAHPYDRQIPCAQFLNKLAAQFLVK